MNLIWNKCSSYQTKDRLESIDKIEGEYNVKLPLLGKRFLLTYLTGQFLEQNESYIDSFLRVTPMSNGVTSLLPGEHFYNWLFSPEEMLLQCKYLSDFLKLYHDYNMLAVGDLYGGASLYLECESGGVFFAKRSDEIKFVKIADDLFQFAESFSLKPLVDFTDFLKRANSIFWEYRNREYNLKASSTIEVSSIFEEDFQSIDSLNVDFKWKKNYEILISSSAKKDLEEELFVEKGEESFGLSIGRIRKRSVYSRMISIIGLNPYSYPLLFDEFRFSAEPYSEILLIYRVKGNKVKIFDAKKRADLIEF
jgi:hypothetical protein